MAADCGVRWATGCSLETEVMEEVWHVLHLGHTACWEHADTLRSKSPPLFFYSTPQPIAFIQVFTSSIPVLLLMVKPFTPNCSSIVCM